MTATETAHAYLDAYAPTLASLVLFGGVASLGVAAGLRVAIEVVRDALACPQTTVVLTDCQQALLALNELVWTFLGGGAAAVVAGIYVLYQLDRDGGGDGAA